MAVYLAATVVLLLLLPDPSWQQLDPSSTSNDMLESSLSMEYQHGKSELVFLLDRSGSISRNDFGVQLFFVESLLTEFSIGPDATKLTIVSYSEDVTRHIDYIAGESGNKCSFLQALKKVKYTDGSSTDIALALQEAQGIFTHSRPDVNRAVILLSDGVSNTGKDPVTVAGQLKTDGVEIFTIGVGLFDRNQLQRIASSAKHFFAYYSFDKFETLALRIRGDPQETMYDTTVNQTLCDDLCTDKFPGQGYGCCDLSAKCSCSLVGGKHNCVCGPGTYGLTGFLYECKLCPRGTYKSTYEPTDGCTPCPLESTTSVEGSRALGACYCKEGYEGDPQNGVPCTLTTCAPLTSPAHGQVIPRDCSNKYQSVCSFHCDLGYQLVDGSSAKRRCNADGDWTGTMAQCRKVQCAALARPANSIVTCENQETGSLDVYGTVCRFSCIEGYNPVGNRNRACLETGQWSGNDFRCRAITCPLLPTVQHGTIQPDVCATSRQPVKSMCHIKCNSGFRREGPPYKRCQASGNWTLNENMFACIDDVAPQVTCPGKVVVEAADGLSWAEVLWDRPTISDNLDGTAALTVVSEPAGITSPHTFPIGTTVVTYTVTDTAGLSNGCAFKVTVEDTQLPIVDSCPDAILDITSSTKETVVTWEEPVFSDNSKEDLVIETPLIRPGDSLPWGTHLVTYTATDSSGNTAECRFTIRLGALDCTKYPEPRNGGRACDEWLMGQFCQVFCNDAYEFAETPAHIYICTGGEWQPIPDGPMPWPDCSEKFPPNGVRQLGMQSRYYAGDCTNAKTQRLIKAAFVQNFKDTFFGKTGGCDVKNACEVEYVTVYCGEIDERRRRKRSGASLDAENEVTIDFTVSAQIREPDENIYEIQMASAAETVEEITNDYEELSRTGQLRLVVDNQTMPVIEDSFTAAHQAVPLCRPGAVVQDATKCINCPVGFYLDTRRQTCRVCEGGTYQDEEGQDHCKRCPWQTSTLAAQSKEEGDCRPLCKPGTYSATGLATCRPCPRGTFQPSFQQTSCYPCREGTTTPAKGTRSGADCQAVCGPGTFSVTGLGPCHSCPLASYQPEEQQTRCLPCPGSSTTTVEGATSEDQCEEIDACESNPCQHGATCSSNKGTFHCQCTSDFTGTMCETEIDECRSQPCLFNATCVDQVGGFDCVCAPGYHGDLCEVEINECSSDPCHNEARCQDQVNGFECDCVDGFRGPLCENLPDLCADQDPCLNGAFCINIPGSFLCLCPLGYHGLRCETYLDECDSQPCQNGGSCENVPGSYNCACASGFEGKQCETNIDDCLRHQCANGSTCHDVIDDYQCLCPPGITGRFCETEISQEFRLRFTNSLTSDFSVVRTGQSEMPAVTLSMWLRSTRSTNLGTPISYAANRPASNSETGASLLDNALTVTDCASLKIYVNGMVVFTDVAVDNGWWNSLVFTWSSADGEWQLYLNGTVVAGGSGLSTEAIPGGGAFVLGQEQDSVGGSFSSRETYLGDIYKLNIWDRVLADEEIGALTGDCTNSLGNVVAWSDFLAVLEGGLAPQAMSYEPGEGPNECAFQ